LPGSRENAPNIIEAVDAASHMFGRLESEWVAFLRLCWGHLYSPELKQNFLD
jgi:hypothetical protein